MKTQILPQPVLDTSHDGVSAKLGPISHCIRVAAALHILHVELDNAKQGIKSMLCNKVADKVRCITIEPRGNLSADALVAEAQMDVRHCDAAGEAESAQTRSVTQTRQQRVVVDSLDADIENGDILEESGRGRAHVEEEDMNGFGSVEHKRLVVDVANGLVVDLLACGQ